MKTRVFTCLIIFIAFTMSGGCTSAASTPTALPTNPPPTSTPTSTPTTLPANPPGATTLQYIGHSSTLITAPDGTRIISDSYGDHPSGLAPFPDNLTADVVTVSHFHPDHSNSSAVKGKPKIISDPGSLQIGVVKITGYYGDHGLILGNSSGNNTVFVFEIGGVKIVHLGAAGVVTQSDILAAMQNADVIIVDIMGDAAHPLQDEWNQLLERNVRTIIPTHYSFDGKPRYYGSATIAEFLQITRSDLPVVRQGSTLQIMANMPKQLVILAPMVNENK
jgi:L-ascorbate metabolism protein UlaG (beta-lactamase superfamily)